MVGLAFMAFSSALCAQNPALADELFTQKDYSAARGQYKLLLNTAPKFPLYLYRYARCLQETGATEEAIHYFQLAGEKYALRNFYLGELYSQTYQFAEAIESFEAYLATLDAADERVESIQKQIEYCRQGQRYLRRVEKITVVDSLVFHLDTIDEIIPDVQSQRPFRYASQLGLIYSCQRLLNGWSEPDYLPEPVNTDAQQINPCVLADGVTIYFASDREGGLGGYDIYRSRFNTNTNTYLNPENVGFPFNSNADDYFMIIDENEGLGYFATNRGCAADYAIMYTYLLNEEPEYLHDTTPEFMRMAAQMKAYDKVDKAQLNLHAGNAQTEEDEFAIDEQPDNKKTVDFVFVINDSTVYTAFSDFKTEEARELYQNVLDSETTISDEIANLDKLRAEYYQADDETRKQLAPVILVAEKTIQNLLDEKKSLIKQIRQLEQ